MHSGRSLRGLFTIVLIGNAVISLAEYGRKRASSSRTFSFFGSSHWAKFSSGRMTGILSCSGRIRSLASVVTMVHDSRAASSLPCQHSHSPANAKARSFAIRM
jgi:hypothetical protein